MPIPREKLLADLRARRLARRLIEIVEQLDAEPLGLASFADPERRSIEASRDALLERLDRAAQRLDPGDALRAAIEDAIAAHRAASVERFAAALVAIRDAMRRSSPPPPTAAAR